MRVLRALLWLLSQLESALVQETPMSRAAAVE